jgi:hypothetical protein
MYKFKKGNFNTYKAVIFFRMTCIDLDECINIELKCFYI